MSNDIKKLLKDILMSIEGIDIHLSGKRDFLKYKENLTTRRAVERELEIIGEATAKILKIDSAFQLTNAKLIVGLVTGSFILMMQWMTT